jgi:hypothetical protein
MRFIAGQRVKYTETESPRLIGKSGTVFSSQIEADNVYVAFDGILYSFVHPASGVYPENIELLSRQLDFAFKE